MPWPLQRVRLESGLKVNLNSLAGRSASAWTDSTGRQIASAYITADMSGEQTASHPTWTIGPVHLPGGPPASFRRSTMVFHVPASA